MITVVQLKNPPIQEALIDIQVSPDQDFDVESFQPLLKELIDTYTDQSPIKGGNFAINFGEDGPNISTEQINEGFMLKTADAQRVVQFKRSGFTLSLVRSYSSWEDFEALAQELWDKYLAVRKPTEIVRLGVRFINSIKLNSADDIPQYFVNHMSFSEGISPAQPKELLYRAVFNNPADPSITGVITHAMNGQQTNGISLDYILDVDAFTFVSFEPTHEDLWLKMAKLREYKNEMFFGSITEKLKKKFEA